MSYVNAFVVPVPKKKVKAYMRMSQRAGKVWKEHGALDYWELVADDVKWGKRTSFPRSVKMKPSETVVFSWIMYSSRKARDRIDAEGDEGSAPGRHDERQGHAVRRQAHDLRGIQEAGALLARRIVHSTVEILKAGGRGRDVLKLATRSAAAETAAAALESSLWGLLALSADPNGASEFEQGQCALAVVHLF